MPTVLTRIPRAQNDHIPLRRRRNQTHPSPSSRQVRMAFLFLSFLFFCVSEDFCFCSESLIKSFRGFYEGLNDTQRSIYIDSTLSQLKSIIYTASKLTEYLSFGHPIPNGFALSFFLLSLLLPSLSFFILSLLLPSLRSLFLSATHSLPFQWL